MLTHRKVLKLFALSIIGLGGVAPSASAAVPDVPLFSRHVVPLFSRLGCNAGSCHGTVKGQNGFRLSLFGADPELDHARLLREASGRRLNVQDVESSLLLQKSSGRSLHQGGVRLVPGSPEYQIVRNWIAGGAKLDRVDQSRIAKLRVTPAEQTLPKGESYSLKVEATFADGSTEDVTALCSFEAVNKELAAVDSAGRVRALGVGDTAIVARYRAEPAMAMLVSPRAGSEPFPAVQSVNFIDKHVLDKLRRLNIHPADLCDDVTFLRRVSLDVTGTPPTPTEIRTFLADKAPDKRNKKIDELLERPAYAALWATKFCDILRPTGFDGKVGFVEAAESRRYYEWLRARFRENTPYDQLAERILLATSREGRPEQDWIKEVRTMMEENTAKTPDLAAYANRRTLDLYWQRNNASGVKGALQVAHAFLGLRLECAQCHRHPNDVWQQDDLLSFARHDQAEQRREGTERQGGSARKHGQADQGERDPHRGQGDLRQRDQHAGQAGLEAVPDAGGERGRHGAAGSRPARIHRRLAEAAGQPVLREGDRQPRLGALLRPWHHRPARPVIAFESRHSPRTAQRVVRQFRQGTLRLQAPAPPDPE
ncbi:MAG: DUF1549 domain-containing protein [Planctomycetes bacterium]|nr:DUF1549 domain-containing protein [Planctomycetota bacterium]